MAPVMEANSWISAAPKLTGERMPNPENPGGHVIAVTGKNCEYPLVPTMPTQWEKQQGKRIADVSS
jgi:hypothetical protein